MSSVSLSGFARTAFGLCAVGAGPPSAQLRFEIQRYQVADDYIRRDCRLRFLFPNLRRSYNAASTRTAAAAAHHPRHGRRPSLLRGAD